MRGQRLGDAVAHGGDQLRALGVGVRRAPPVSELRPAVGLERDLARLPRALAHLHGGLQQRELVDPCREAALPAIGVQLAHDRHQCVVRCLSCKIVELARAGAAAASDLKARRAQQQRVERFDRFVMPAAPAGERLDPADRFGVGAGSVESWRGFVHGGPGHANSDRPYLCSQHGRGSSSSGARIRAARAGGHPRSMSSSTACRSMRQSRASRTARSGANPAATRRPRRQPTTAPNSARVPRAVEAEDANLRAGEEREPDVLEDDVVGGVDLPQTLHDVDVFGDQQRILVSDE